MTIDLSQFKVRNSWVLLRIFKSEEEMVGNIHVPSDNKEYTEGEVLGIGPDFPQAAGGVPGTIDLKVGQRVLVNHLRVQHRPGAVEGTVKTRSVPNGIPLEVGTNKDGNLFLFEQTLILAIVKEAPVEEFPEAEQAGLGPLARIHPQV